MSDPTSATDHLEVSPGFTHENLQGWIPSLADDGEVREALEKAFDYRGDVTIVCKDGSKVDGYVYDRRQADSLAGSLVRILPSDGSPRRSIPFADIATLTFSGRDTAAGRSWEAWVRKYWEKKQVGETAAIEPDSLE